VIVRWGIGKVGPLLTELGNERPLLVTSSRFADVDVPVADRFSGVRRHSPVEVAAAATAAAAESDGLVAVGGGSAIDTAKAVSARTGKPLVAIPTTYSGAEWTRYFGMRDEARRAKTGGSGANTVAVVYEPALTFDLPVGESVGTALNALAHCAEALYAGPYEEATVGAALISRALPEVAANGHDVDARTRLLEGAMHAGRALAERGLFLAHAMAQGLGGRYGAPHGALNALCLAPALRFNEPIAPEAIAALAIALDTDDAPARVGELARLGGFERLRDLGIPEDELDAVAAEVAQRPGALSNPRPASPADISALLHSIW
jgi:maleylacetate reductase